MSVAMIPRQGGEAKEPDTGEAYPASVHSNKVAEARATAHYGQPVTSPVQNGAGQAVRVVANLIRAGWRIGGKGVPPTRSRPR